jgi:hypothetical protein
MAQPPLQVDQVQIEPGLTGTRLVNAHTDGDLQFTDPNVVAVLSDLVGFRNITGVFVVGDGAGAPYATIQDAVDEIPDTSDVDNPSLILITGGAYSENIVIDKDGVWLVGLGGVKITNAAADATISIVDAPTTTPQKVVLRNLTIVNTTDAEECVKVEGAGTYASGTVTANTAPLAAGDTVTIGGTALTGVAGTRTSGSDDFSIDGLTTDTIAAEILEALNDAANSFAATITATRVGSIVTITANTPGAGGNAITLAVNTVPPGGLTASGATLTGGGASGSMVAYDEVAVLDCDLIASGNGGFQVYADTVNNIRVQGGTWRGSSSTSIAWATNCASFRVFGVEWTNDYELLYDTALDQPAITTSEYEAKHCDRANDVLCNLTGDGSLVLAYIQKAGEITFGGDRTLEVDYCDVEDLALSGTTATTLVHTRRDLVGVAGGTPTLQESSLTGSQAFAASAAEVVSFDADQPDADYAVYVDSTILGTDVKVTAKTVSDFTISASAPITDTVYWTVERRM